MAEFDYRKLGIIGEPYFDMDLDQFFYLTDTGRRWDVSVGESIERRASEGLTVAEPVEVQSQAFTGNRYQPPLGWLAL